MLPSALIALLIAPQLAPDSAPLAPGLDAPEPSTAAPAAAPEPPASFEGPSVLVPAPTRAGAPISAAHRALVEALQARFGPRVVDVSRVLDAQQETSITATVLRVPPAPAGATRAGPPPPPALARLGAAVGAERAILVEVRDRETRCLVYPALDGAPAVVVTVPRKKGDALDASWAAAVAAEIDKLAGGALEDPARDGIVMGEPATEPAVYDARAEMQAEEARERARRQAAVAKMEATDAAQDPRVAGFVGGGGALRFFSVGGGGARALLPVENGVVPTVSVALATSPLGALGVRSRWSDVQLELGYRRGFATVTDPHGGATCPYDDDDFAARATWRVIPVDGPWMPRVGLGVGGGLERVELGCDLAVLSTRYPHALAVGRVTQPLLPRTELGPASDLELDLSGGLRAVFADEQGALAPSLVADAFVTWRPLRLLAARAGARLSSTHVESGAGPGALVVDDTRLSLEAQLGGTF